jgi:fructokinase
MTSPPTLVGLGEVLWDLFPEGPRFGGAPANFACHAAMLGARAAMVSQVGDDALGRQALEALGRHGVDTTHVARSPRFPTGTVQVEVDAAGQPRFEIREGVAWDQIPWSDSLATLARGAAGVCFGTLAQRHEVSRGTIRRFLESTAPGCLRIFDVNLRQHFYSPQVVLDSLNLATALKLNHEELPVVVSLCGIAADRDALPELARRFGLQWVALTRGAQGAVLWTDQGRAECGGVKVQVQDTVGAGDAFTAALAVGILSGRDPATICEHACRVAAFVCTQPGATPMLPPELLQPYP